MLLDVLRGVVRFLASHMLLLFMFAIGLRLDFGMLRAQARRPVFRRGLFVALVLVPLLAAAVAAVLPLSQLMTGVILLMAVSPGVALLVLRVQKDEGNVPLAVAFTVTLSAATIVTVPLWLTLLRVPFPNALRAEPAFLFEQAFTVAFLPLLAGMLVRRLLPARADRLGDLAMLVFKVVLVGVAVLAVLVSTRALRDIGGWGLLAMLLVTSGAAILGHLAGGPRPEDRSTLAIVAAFGNPAIVLHIASVSRPDIQAVPIVLAYVLLRLVALVPYERWWRSRRGRPTTSARPPAAPPPGGIFAGRKASRPLG